MDVRKADERLLRENALDLIAASQHRPLPRGDDPIVIELEVPPSSPTSTGQGRHGPTDPSKGDKKVHVEAVSYYAPCIY